MAQANILSKVKTRPIKHAPTQTTQTSISVGIVSTFRHLKDIRPSRHFYYRKKSQVKLLKIVGCTLDNGLGHV